MTPPVNPAGPAAAGDPVAAGYAEALAELEEILAALERSDVDVDVLAEKVQRAAALIGFSATTTDHEIGPTRRPRRGNLRP